MTIPNPLCWLKTLFVTLYTGAWTRGATVAGHAFREDSRLNNCIVTVVKCEWCGKYEVAWEPTARSTREPYPDERRTA